MSRHVFRFWPQYGIPLLAITLTTLVSVLLRHQLEYTRSIFYIPAVIVSAWFGGIRGGILATALSVIVIDYYLVPPYGSITSFQADFYGLISFLFIAFSFTYLTARRRNAEEALRLASFNKGKFLNILAHELRNPMDSIRLASEILKMAPRDGRQIERQCESINRQITHMSRLLDDLLDLSRIGLNKISLHTEQLNLGEILGCCVDYVMPLIQEKGLRIEFRNSQESVWISGDRVRLEQVFGNLINNAIKYNKADGSIEISVSVITRDKSFKYAAVCIHDSGVGIDEKLLPFVFDLYAQAPSAISNPGLGIGLALVKGLVELQGGNIEAKSQGAGKGSEFIVKLPVLKNGSLNNQEIQQAETLNV